MSDINLRVFSIETQEYGINNIFIQEIISIPLHITRIPKGPKYVEGLFEFKGEPIPIVNLKKRFGFMGICQNSESNRLLVLKFENMRIGVIVDEVSEVIKINDSQSEKIFLEIPGISDNSIKGICSIDKRIVLIIDVIKLTYDMKNFLCML